MNYSVTDTQLTSIADAIRAKTGGTASLSFPDGFVSGIGGIETMTKNTSDEKTLPKSTVSIGSNKAVSIGYIDIPSSAKAIKSVNITGLSAWLISLYKVETIESYQRVSIYIYNPNSSASESVSASSLSISVTYYYE